MKTATPLLLAALVLLAGCSTLPVFVPDLHGAGRPACR